MIDRRLLVEVTLDRAAAYRRDQDWMAERLRHPLSRFVPVWRDRNLVEMGSEPRAVALGGAGVSDLLAGIASEIILLGVEGETAYFAADLSHHEPPALAEILGEAEFADIRNHRGLLENGAGAMLLQARGLMYWHRHNRFCSGCGAPTQSTQSGYARVCTHPDCGREHFPRLDPAIIVLVTRNTPDGELCLLAHKGEWEANRYATIAGFVEPGETIEEAVRREVMEEVGVAVTDVRYQASQPWPFPASLMLAFRACAASERIKVDNVEVSDARWFSRAEVLSAPANGLQIARGGSISRWLVDGWLTEG